MQCGQIKLRGTAKTFFLRDTRKSMEDYRLREVNTNFSFFRDTRRGGPRFNFGTGARARLSTAMLTATLQGSYKNQINPYSVKNHRNHKFSHARYWWWYMHHWFETSANDKRISVTYKLYLAVQLLPWQRLSFLLALQLLSVADLLFLSLLVLKKHREWQQNTKHIKTT